MTGNDSRNSAPATLWSPLRNRSFAVLWSAWMVGNLCMWMTDVAAAWFMTTLSDSKAMVALVQTASALPAFLLALPGGALADLVDRRRWLLASQLWMVASVGLLALMAFTGSLSPVLLLAMMFCGGVGFAMRWPVFSALVPEVVSRDELSPAMGLHAVAVNASRIAGPVVAGVLYAAGGGAWVFGLGAALWLACALTIWRWPHTSPQRRSRGERLAGAMRAGLRYAWRSASMRAAMVRGFLLFVTVSALLGLLPLVALQLGGSDGAAVYTLLFSCLGLGAVLSVLALQRIRAHTSPQAIVTMGMCLFACMIACAALATSTGLAALALLVAGGAWMSVGNTLTIHAQFALPDRLRARGMAIFLMAVMAGSASGAAAFGLLADLAGLRAALLTLAAGVLASSCWLRTRYLVHR